MFLFFGCDNAGSGNGEVADSSKPTLDAPQEAKAGEGVLDPNCEDCEDEENAGSGISGMLTAPIVAKEKFKQFAVLDIQIKSGVDAFRAYEGRYPTNEEFMTQIVEKYRLNLPVVPDDVEYYFDNQTGKLMLYPKDQLPSK